MSACSGSLELAPAFAISTKWARSRADGAGDMAGYMREARCTAGVVKDVIDRQKWNHADDGAVHAGRFLGRFASLHPYVERVACRGEESYAGRCLSSGRLRV